ncbi:DUF5906 domain-containing protein [Yoonia sp.]|nr:DUF5906 domain-containing protein [Yoonia sp.]MDC1399165.1 DUF5906 domain-containing protein [Yoonia sp.]
MSPKRFEPDPPLYLERWNENLAEHVEPFPPVPERGEATFTSLEIILKTIAQWYVRKDGKYYDVEEFGPVFSRDDVERIIIQRLKGEFAGKKLSQDDVRQLLQVAIRDIFVDPRRSIPIWSGLRQSMPGNPNRLSFERMAATINTWREPPYRRLGNIKADWGPFEDFMKVTFTREDERRMLTDWLAWCLQNEDDKPGWAPFLFSAEKGSGKSTFAKIAGLLFGDQNTATENNINKLVSRFNAPVLEKKLVICEELYLPPGSDKANAVKTFITEKDAVVEHKFQAVQQVQQVCCFVFITNHKPVWLEQGDRRFYVVHVDHDGHRFGPNGGKYASQVAALFAYLEDPRHVAALYKAFKAHKVAEDFNPHSLEVIEKATAVMREIQESSFDITRKAVEEYLAEHDFIAVNIKGADFMVEQRLATKITVLKHVLADLGWVSKNAKWGGKDYKRMIWLKPGYTLVGGVISGPDTWELNTARDFPTGGKHQAGFYKYAEGERTDLDDDDDLDINF